MFFFPFGTREANRKQRFAYVTLLLAAVNVSVFLYMLYLGVSFGEERLAGFFGDYAAVPADVTDGTPLEAGIFTSMFLHAGLLHLLGNMLYFLPFGDNVEDRLGHLRYLLFYIACGLIATLVFIGFNANSTTPLVGASGAIAGILGGYLALHPRGTVKGLLIIVIYITKVQLPAFLFIGYWFLTQLFSTYASLGANVDAGGVAFLAHVAGFIAGLVLAPLMLATVKKSHPAHEQSSAAAVED
ncbi:rhomboid family intramembrane serine protease [Candidatus Saccharibacteria bacterium]|nr:rhomboid family intramembrane serine protease [Candidatus Saccharibacteria bacterium]